uniref:Uncharacterized protein n=1 Tax=Physcomitrium patens TaxID=3218 RepID=A0A2K1J0I0_PHYPA|nr:hypothetical protein PHYPA_022932 [Physcomitrium patens]
MAQDKAFGFRDLSVVEQARWVKIDRRVLKSRCRITLQTLMFLLSTHLSAGPYSTIANGHAYIPGHCVPALPINAYASYCSPYPLSMQAVGSVTPATIICPKFHANSTGASYD